MMKTDERQPTAGPELDLLTIGPIRYTFGTPTNSWWRLFGWWGLFRDGRDPKLVAFGNSQAKGFGLIRDWVETYVDARDRQRPASEGAAAFTSRDTETST